MNSFIPDWKPLHRAVRLAGLDPSILRSFMWMGEGPRGIHQYKHCDTRNYAHLSIDATPDNCKQELAVACSMERTWGKAIDVQLAEMKARRETRRGF